MDSRRILVTGLSTYWGGRLAQTLEQIPEVEAIVGVDNKDPTCELQRTEFVRVGAQHALIRRVVQAAEIDTVIDTRLVVDSVTTSSRLAHENNVIGTMNILAAAGGPDSPVRKLVFKSSAHYYGCEQDDPAFFTEEMSRPHPPRTPIERDIVEAESAVREFADKNPDATVTILRCCNGLGPDIQTSHIRLFGLPVIPTILGFDPRYQFIHEDDIVGCLEFAVRNDVHGIYNAAGDGVLALSEVIDLLGKQMAPILPPWGTGLAAAPLNRLGLRIPSEMLQQMRFGRGLDNRKLKAAGYRYRYTTRESVVKLREHQRLHSLVRSAKEPYRYEREVEEFLRWSPSVRATGVAPGGGPLPPRELAQLQRLLTKVGEDQVPANVAPAWKRAEKEEEVAAQEAAAARPGDEAIEKAERAAGRAEAAAERAQAAPGASAPSVPAPSVPAPAAERPPVDEYDELEAEEVIALLGSLDPDDLETLHRHEAAHRARPAVLRTLEGLLTRAGRSPGTAAAPHGAVQS